MDDDLRHMMESDPEEAAARLVEYDAVCTAMWAFWSQQESMTVAEACRRLSSERDLLEGAIAQHRKAMAAKSTLYHDEALYAAHDRVLKDATKGQQGED